MIRSKSSSNKKNLSGPKSGRKQAPAQLNISEDPPPADMVCRVCLKSQLKLYNISVDLQNVYETVTREQFNKVGHPLSLCYNCLAELRKCQKFMETARDSNRVLEHWYNQQYEMKDVKPQNTNTVIKEETLTIETEEVSLQHVKEEQIELEPEYVECELSIDVKKREIDEQTDYRDDPNDSYNATVQGNIAVDQPPETSSKLYQLLTFNYSQRDDSNIKGEETEVKPTFAKRDDEIEINKSVASNNQCPVCKFTCVSYTALARHSLFHDTSRPYVCTTCQYRFEDSHHLKSHETMHKNVTKNKTKPSKCNKYFCDKCDFKCIMKRVLQKHMRTHTGDKPFSCDLCNYKCGNKRRLTEHLMTHSGEKPHSCNVCSFRTPSRHTLINHMKTHNGEKPYTCEICFHKLTTNSRLKEHMKKHTGVRPYSCDLCNLKFINKSNLTSHIRRHTGEKPFLCDICSSKFFCMYGLKKHILSKHTNDKSFTCTICSYKSSRKDNLRTHMRTHTGEKPFSCDLCDYKYSHRVSLKQHLLIKHKIDDRKTDTTKPL